MFKCYLLNLIKHRKFLVNILIFQTIKLISPFQFYHFLFKHLTI